MGLDMKRTLFLSLAIFWIILALVMTFFYPFRRPLLDELGAARYFAEPIFFFQPFGTLWMVYQAVRHEPRPLQYVVLACFPFAFIWYYFERVRPRKSSSLGVNTGPSGGSTPNED
jgi:hypothetical protein